MPPAEQMRNGQECFRTYIFVLENLAPRLPRDWLFLRGRGCARRVVRGATWVDVRHCFFVAVRPLLKVALIGAYKLFEYTSSAAPTVSHHTFSLSNRRSRRGLPLTHKTFLSAPILLRHVLIGLLFTLGTCCCLPCPRIYLKCSISLPVVYAPYHALYKNRENTAVVLSSYASASWYLGGV